MNLILSKLSNLECENFRLDAKILAGMKSSSSGERGDVVV